MNVIKQEPDAALGNRGLGRLVSCFLDSAATLNYPVWGYGLPYRYGLFKQYITKDGRDEVAEDWLDFYPFLQFYFSRTEKSSFFVFLDGIMYCFSAERKSMGDRETRCFLPDQVLQRSYCVI